MGVFLAAFSAGAFFAAAFLADLLSLADGLEAVFTGVAFAGVRLLVSRLFWSKATKSTTLVAESSRRSGSSKVVVAPACFTRFLMMSDRRSRNSSW